MAIGMPITSAVAGEGAAAPKPATHVDMEFAIEDAAMSADLLSEIEDGVLVAADDRVKQLIWSRDYTVFVLTSTQINALRLALRINYDRCSKLTATWESYRAAERKGAGARGEATA